MSLHSVFLWNCPFNRVAVLLMLGGFVQEFPRHKPAVDRRAIADPSREKRRSG